MLYYINLFFQGDIGFVLYFLFALMMFLFPGLQQSHEQGVNRSLQK